MSLTRNFCCRRLLVLCGAFLTGSPFAYSSPDLSISPQSLRQQAFQHILEGGDPNFEGKKVIDLYQAAIDKSEKEYGPTAGYTAELYFEMGNYAFDISNFKLANLGLTKALQINPNLIAARIRLSQLDEVAKRPDYARDQMRQLLLRHGDSKVGQNRLIALMQKSDPVGATRQAYLFQHQGNALQPKILSQPHPQVVKPPQEAVAETKPDQAKSDTSDQAKSEQAKAEAPAKPTVTANKSEAPPALKQQGATNPPEQSTSQISSVLWMRTHHLKPPAQPANPKPADNEIKSPDPNAAASVTTTLSPSAQKARTEEELRKHRLELLQQELLVEQQLKAIRSNSTSLNYSAQANAKKAESGAARVKKHKSAPPSSDSPKIATTHSSEGRKSSHKSGGGSMLIPPPPPTSLVLPGPSFPMAMPLRPDLMNPAVQIKTAAKIMKQPKAKPSAEAKASAEEKPEAKVEKPKVAPTGSEDADPEFLIKWAGTQKKKK